MINETLEIYKLFDNEGKTWDRYTILFLNSDMCLGLSDNCDMPNGYSQWGNYEIDGDDFSRLGKEIQLSDLPENVQKHLEKRMIEE